MITEIPFKSVDDTIKAMFALIIKYANNPALDFFDNMTIQEVFDYIAKKIKYVADPMNVPFLNFDSIELVKSPVKTIEYKAGDCDCKAVLVGSIMKRAKIPFRLAISSNNPNKKFHHVYPDIFFNSKWKTFDATYDKNKMFEEKPYTAKRIYENHNNLILKKTIK